MNEELVQSVESGLDQLIAKYKKNLHPQDSYRLQAAIDAKQAIRRIGFRIAIAGDVTNIHPIIDDKKGAGWEIKDLQNKSIQYFRS